MNWATSVYGAGIQAQVVGPQNGPLRAGVATPATAVAAVRSTVRMAAHEADTVVHRRAEASRCGRA